MRFGNGSKSNMLHVCWCCTFTLRLRRQLCRWRPQDGALRHCWVSEAAWVWLRVSICFDQTSWDGTSLPLGHCSNARDGAHDGETRLKKRGNMRQQGWWTARLEIRMSAQTSLARLNSCGYTPPEQVSGTSAFDEHAQSQNPSQRTGAWTWENTRPKIQPLSLSIHWHNGGILRFDLLSALFADTISPEALIHLLALNPLHRLALRCSGVFDCPDSSANCGTTTLWAAGLCRASMSTKPARMAYLGLPTSSRGIQILQTPKSIICSTTLPCCAFSSVSAPCLFAALTPWWMELWLVKRDPKGSEYSTELPN